MSKKTKQIRTAIYPIGKALEGEYKIADHINLNGEAIRGLGFIPVTDLYIDKNNPEAIIVAGIKAGIKPNNEEKSILEKQGVHAYSYDLIKPALHAAASDEQIEAIGYIPRIPNGFKFYSQSSGLKRREKLDFGLIYSESEADAVGVYTQNLARAFCVNENSRLIQNDNSFRVISCNSGNANACCGEASKLSDLRLRQELGAQLRVKQEEILHASTGKIGIELDTSLITKNFDKSLLNNDLDSLINFAEAILTTDTIIKISQDSKQNILGIAKGSGMIYPNMATMLGFLVTDVKIAGLNKESSKSFMQEALREITQTSFNSISVDGDTSTNDMVLLANNYSGKEISQEEFKASLEQVCQDLAYKIVADGEGLTKIMELKLSGNQEPDVLRKLGKTITNSLLVKTALHGNDPNWGRVIAALGQAASEQGIEVDINKVKLSILGTEVFSQGKALDFSRDELSAKMNKALVIDFDLCLDEQATNQVTLLGNDLSYDYVKINAEYFT